MLKPIFVFFFIINTLCISAFASNDKLKNLETSLEDLADVTFSNLPRYLLSCRADNKRCGLNQEELDTLLKIYQYVFKLSNSDKDNKLVFLWESEAEGIFDLRSGAHRLAVTANNMNSKIYINKDFAINREKGTILDQAEMISILVHEYGHHTGLEDNDERILDKLANAVKTKFLSLSETIDLSSLGLPHLKLSLHNSTSRTAVGSWREFRGMLFVAMTGDHVSGLGGYLVDSTKVPEDHVYSSEYLHIAARFPKICKNIDYIQSIQNFNLRWEKLPRKNDYIGKKVTAVMDTVIYCGKTIQTSSKIETKHFFTGKIAQKNNAIEFINNDFFIQGKLIEAPDTTGLQVNIKKLKMNKSTIIEGGEWLGEGIVHTSREIDIYSCTFTISSDQFFSIDPENGSHELSNNNCKMTKAADGTWKLFLKYNVSPEYSNAQIYIKRLAIDYRENGEEKFIFSFPMVRTSLEIQNSRNERDYDLLGVELLDDKFNNYFIFSDYNFLKKNIIYKLTFNTCKVQFEVDTFYSTLRLMKGEQSFAALNYAVATTKDTFMKSQVASIYTNECIDGKRVVHIGFNIYFGPSLQMLLKMGLEYLIVEDIFFAGLDLRNYKFDMSNQKLMFDFDMN